MVRALRTALLRRGEPLCLIQLVIWWSSKFGSLDSSNCVRRSRSSMGRRFQEHCPCLGGVLVRRTACKTRTVKSRPQTCNARKAGRLEVGETLIPRKESVAISLGALRYYLALQLQQQSHRCQQRKTIMAGLAIDGPRKIMLMNDDRSGS